VTDELVERLTQHQTLGGVPRKQLEWLASRGIPRTLEAGEAQSREMSVVGLHIMLSGHISIHVDTGTGKRKVMEWRGGDVVGLMPYSRMVSPPGDVVAEAFTELLTIAKADFPDLIRECHEVTAILVHKMLDRARHFTSSYLHDEKLVSLGKLAAGLAHELNNPASALTRSAKTLGSAVEKTESAARALALAGLSSEQIAAIDEVRRISLTSRVHAIRSPLEQEDREMSIVRWLKSHGAHVSAAEPLAETDLSLEALDVLAHKLEGDALDSALCWIANTVGSRRLIDEICEASSRVYNLVGAVKGFTQMDRASVPEPVDVRLGLGNTIMVLGSKARSKSTSVSSSVEPDLPRIHGFGAELNQVWANVIDNAIDAAGEGGRVEVTASRDGNHVLVRITDNGPGIPDAIINRIFDPFFTTKPVGSGTGLGLDIVRRLIQRHNGQIEVASKPGLTEFRIRLPIQK